MSTTPPDLQELHRLAESGDVSGALRVLRSAVATGPDSGAGHTTGPGPGLPTHELAAIVGRLAAAMDFDDLVQAATALAAAPESPEFLYDFGSACIGRGVSFLAVPMLREVLRQVPDARGAWMQLALALEREERHAEAAAVLEEHQAALRPWPDRYLLTYNSLMAGDLDRARTHLATLPAPEDADWAPAHTRLRSMLRRATSVSTAAPSTSLAPLGAQDLRGWHFALTGGILTSFSPYGFTSGMTGRYGLLKESPEQSLYGLFRLRLVLDAAGVSPRTVSLLPDRSSRILGLAASRFLGLPAEPFAPGRPDTVVISYSLGVAEPQTLAHLRERAPGQVLYEHATCWTSPLEVAADITTLLGQFVLAPWDKGIGPTGPGMPEQRADDRPAESVANELLRAEPTPDPGDGDTPADPDESLTGFVRTVRDHWLTGPREQSPSAGPVRSSRFL
ncbi:hypothetical protein [Streptomyces sp. MST-110588]|uniref:hypothetical protein n=1 Tax=Streptomyces sp. MST-110588 TaxID=2833628 RepID=UPI001F5CD438|nr:hypothetical protein [Streptomyces sp. MST-110588]UNO39204.1 hypothetical protein KGS77_05625 [Streptomyces sp. MST-110588]